MICLKQGDNMGIAEVVIVFAIVSVNLGIVFALHLQTDRKINEIILEMKNFHGRLVKIEERNKK